VAPGTERLAAAKAAAREPCSTEHPVADHRFACIVGARRKKPARPGKIWRYQQLVAIEQCKGQLDTNARTGTPAAVAWAEAGRTAVTLAEAGRRTAVALAEEVSPTPTVEADGDSVRRCCGIRSQGQSDWRRATRAWEPRRRQSRAQSCDDGKPLESGASLYFSQPLPPGAWWRLSPAGRSTACSPERTGWQDGHEPWCHVRKPAETPPDGGCARVA